MSLFVVFIALNLLDMKAKLLYKQLIIECYKWNKKVHERIFIIQA